MNLEFISFNSDIEHIWDKFVADNRLPLTYSYSALMYLATAKNQRNLSFLAVRKGVVALVPILLSDSFAQENKLLDSIEPQLFPCIQSNVSYEDKIAIIEHLRQLLDRNHALKERLFFEIRYWCRNHNGLSAQNLEYRDFEVKEESNSDLVINFCTSSELILRRNHIRNEKKSVLLGDNVSIYDSRTDLLQLEPAFQRFIDCFEGKILRKSPANLNSLMFNMIREGKGYLFESRNRELSKSFLFCDANGVFARGWRQVNSLNIAKNENPRVLLEKTAIEFFRAEGYCGYHIGEILDSSAVFDSKLASINHFKLGFNPIRLGRTKVQMTTTDSSA